MTFPGFELGGVKGTDRFLAAWSVGGVEACTCAALPGFHQHVNKHPEPLLGSAQHRIPWSWETRKRSWIPLREICINRIPSVSKAAGTVPIAAAAVRRHIRIRALENVRTYSGATFAGRERLAQRHNTRGCIFFPLGG